MESVEFWAWWITSETTGKRVRARWKMTAETAAGYPVAERVEGTMELRSAAPAGDAHHLCGMQTAVGQPDYRPAD